MRRSSVLRLVLLAAVACLATAAGAQQAWISVDGGPANILTPVANPDYGTGSLEYPWIYDYTMFANADYPQVIHITGGGVFKDAQGKAIRLRLQEYITNTGQERWFDFHILVGGDGRPYTKWSELPIGWGVTQTLTGYDYAPEFPQYAIGPGGFFMDGIKIHVLTDAQGNGTFDIWKWPTVPEPSTLVALTGGLAALGAGVRYRKLRK